MNYTAIPDSEVAQDQPASQSLFRKLRDNPIAISEGSAGAPRLNPKAVNGFDFFATTNDVSKAYNTTAGFAQVEFTNEVLDRGGFWDNSSAPYCQLAPLSPGWYAIDVALVVTRNSQDTFIRLRKNGNVVAERNVMAGTNSVHCSLSTMVQMNGTTDTFDVAIGNASGTVTVPAEGTGQSYIKGKKIAE